MGNLGNIQSSRFGVDVASSRADDLDKKILAEIATLQNPEVLDLGCGAGGQSLRMAKAGALVTGVDIQDFGDTFKTISNSNNLDVSLLKFIHSDLRQFLPTLSLQAVNLCLFQRTLHYFPHYQAVSILKSLKSTVNNKLFISVTGLESDIAIQYQDKEKVISERFCRLETSDAEKFSIHEPICLYSQAEFISTLESAGWKILHCRTSDFGNHKAVCE